MNLLVNRAFTACKEHRRKWVMELLRLPYSPSSVLTPNLCCCPVLTTLVGANKDEYRPFAEITENSLLHALDESGLGFTDANVGPVLEAYRSLEPFPDVVQALNDITAEQRFECVLFSNGSRDMLSQSFRGSDELGRYWSCFKALVTADDVKKYKPAPEVYQHLTRVVQKTGDKPTIWLVSSNPFDIVGARACGLQALWIDRIGHGWQDRQASRPSAIAQSLTDLQEAVT